MVIDGREASREMGRAVTSVEHRSWRWRSQAVKLQ
jgi:hypothetical protein